jgi:hypothetical protein
VEIASSKRAVTKQYESLNYEILKYVDVTEQYLFTIDEVLAGKLSEEQKKLLAYILKESGVPYDNSNNNTEEED